MDSWVKDEKRCRREFRFWGISPRFMLVKVMLLVSELEMVMEMEVVVVMEMEVVVEMEIDTSRV